MTRTGITIFLTVLCLFISCRGKTDSSRGGIAVIRKEAKTPPHPPPANPPGGDSGIQADRDKPISPQTAEANIQEGESIPDFKGMPGAMTEKMARNLFNMHRFFSMEWNQTGGQEHDFEQRILNDNKVIIEHNTGLMWHWSGPEEKLTFEQAEQWVEQMNRRGYAGFSDWRLPTLMEAASLLQPRDGDADYFINTLFFDTLQSVIWTCIPAADAPESNWVVNYGTGIAARYPRAVSEHIRPVRSLR